MASDVYLIRKVGGQWAKYTAVTGLKLTGAVSSYAGVTGVASTDVITVTGSALVNGDSITFTSLTGGLGITVNTKYYVIAASGATFQISSNQGGALINFTTNITAATVLVQTDELYVWSSEFRDIFTATTPLIASGPASPGGSVAAASAIKYTDPVVITPGNGAVVPSTFESITATPFATTSDEINHWQLRQTYLSRTHWVFDRGVSIAPRFLYATWADGDIIADNPPEEA